MSLDGLPDLRRHLTSTVKPPCEQCPYRLDAPRGVWALDHYLSLLGKEHRPEEHFFCHESRRLPEKTPCLGFEAMRDGQTEGLFTSGFGVVRANVAAFKMLDDGVACDGSGVQVRPEAIKATCPECRQVLPSNGELPLHLSLTAADLDGLDPEFDGEQGE